MPARQPPVEHHISSGFADHPQPTLAGATASLFASRPALRAPARLTLRCAQGCAFSALPRSVVRVIASEGSFVGLDVAALEQFAIHLAIAGFQPLGRNPDPVGHGLPGDRGAPAPRHLFEPIERCVIDVFGERDPREQSTSEA